MDILGQYVMRLPADQNVLDLFDGEWSSQMPPESGLHARPGPADLFSDSRIVWAEHELGGFRDKSVLELGPLEGGHSYMLQRAGAKSVVSVEANARAFLKCLCIKELFCLDRVHFKLGDFVSFLEHNTTRFDITIASGVLYHMADPIRFLDLLSKSADRILIWTHYFDQEIIAANPMLAERFARIEKATYEGFQYQFASQAYKQALEWAGFCGGPQKACKWLTRSSILEFLQRAGFTSLKVNFEHATHPNGPAFAVCASRN
jgi:hypothetical protein